ncbi:MAG: exodeoxyribonuclease III [Alphaproteobacteria bacterium]|nr:exodeoxyribonuclease III [Alphaproteobacteria bacterium]
MKIATYNVNSINARIENLAAWLQRERPDIVLLQEIKSEFNAFPFFDLQVLGYEAKILGQKSYNGVAVLSKHKIKVVEEGLPNFSDENSRYIEVEIEVEGVEYRVASVYLPNGNPPYNNPEDESKWLYKLKWMEAFYNHAKKLSDIRKPIILGGDFNVILTDDDVYNPEEFRNNALFRPEVVQRLKAFQFLGYYDAFREYHPDENGYTFWDYAGASLQNDMGMRIDYLWLNSYAMDKLNKILVDKTPRQDVKPSDHTVLMAVFD